MVKHIRTRNVEGDVESGLGEGVCVELVGGVGGYDVAMWQKGQDSMGGNAIVIRRGGICA